MPPVNDYWSLDVLIDSLLSKVLSTWSWPQYCENFRNFVDSTSAATITDLLLLQQQQHRGGRGRRRGERSTRSQGEGVKEGLVMQFI